MKYVFFGSPEFAAIILEKLINADWPPAVVVCNPDRPVGRKQIITSPPSKIIAQRYGIKVWQPEKFEAEAEKLMIGKIDFAIVAAYAKILPKEIIELPRLGTIGVHPSLLPKYRGATPIQSAILAGEKETGVTLFLIDERVDHGSIFGKSEILIQKSETHETLMKKLAALSGDLLTATLPKFIKGEIKPRPQDESLAIYTKKFITEDGYVDLEKDDPIVIERKIRALNPEPGVWFRRKGKRIKILEAELVDGKLKLKKIQEEGKKPTLFNF